MAAGAPTPATHRFGRRAWNQQRSASFNVLAPRPQTADPSVVAGAKTTFRFHGVLFRIVLRLILDCSLRMHTALQNRSFRRLFRCKSNTL